MKIANNFPVKGNSCNTCNTNFFKSRKSQTVCDTFNDYEYKEITEGIRTRNLKQKINSNLHRAKKNINKFLSSLQ